MRIPRRALLALLFAPACRRPYKIGDHVLVAWRGADSPAVIVGIEGPAKFRVHYDGFSEDWDETVPATRIHGRLSTVPGAAPSAPPPKRVQTKTLSPSASAPVSPPNVYRVGDRLRVEWHGSIYTATVVSVLGDDRYRVHYEGYGNEWEEDIGLSRIQRKGGGL